MFRFSRFLSVMTCLAFGFIIPGTMAASKNTPPKKTGTFGKWSTYVMTQKGKRVCYMVSRATRSKGKYKKRGPVYTIITHYKGDSYNVVSINAGYSFSPGATVSVSIGKENFKLYTEGETAWAPNSMDKPLTLSIRKGTKMIVKGVSSRGTATEDWFDLKGSHQALQEINKLCQVRP